MSNQQHGRRVNREANFAAFDMLPPHLRRTLRYATAKWGAQSILNEFDRLVYSCNYSDAAAEIAIIRGIARQEPEDTYRTYGPDHPEADSHGRQLRPHKFACWTPRKRQGAEHG